MYRIFKAQIENPKHNDWINLVRKDMENIGLYISDINIEKLSKCGFEKIVKDLCFKEAINYLNKKKENHTKNYSNIIHYQ